MTILDRFRKEKAAPRPARRGKADPASARLRIENRALSRLERTDPARLDELVLQRAGYIPVPPTPKGDVEVYLSTAAKLEKAGLLPDPQGPEWLRALGSGMGQVLMQYLGGRGLAPTTPSEPPSPPYYPPAAVVEVSAPSPPTLLAPSNPTEPQEATQVDVSAVAIQQLSGRDPTQAARFLIDLPDPRVRGLIGRLCEANDAGIPAVLFSVQQQSPEFAGLVEWLLDVRNVEWTVATVHSLRDIAGVPSTAVAVQTVRAAGDWSGV